MAFYTIAVRERGKMQAFKYIASDTSIVDTPDRCKRLSRSEAATARRVLMEKCEKAGRPIDCRVVTLDA